jgi:hypothetical protein
MKLTDQFIEQVVSKRSKKNGLSRASSVVGYSISKIHLTSMLDLFRTVQLLVVMNMIKILISND